MSTQRPVVVLNGFATRAGGAVTRLEQLARRMPAVLGVDIVAVAPRESGLTLDGTASHLVLVPRIAERLPGYLRKGVEPRVISLVVRRARARVVLHFGSYVPIGRTAGVKNILCFTNVAPWATGYAANSVRNRLLQRLFEMTHTRADAVIVQSEATRQWLAERYPAVGNRLFVVRNGCVMPALTRPAETCGFIALGDVHRYRRFDEVVSAHAKLPAAVRARHPLLIAGSLERDRNAVAALLQSVAGAGNPGDVQLLGKLPRSRVLQLLAASTAFVAFAAVENGPNAVCEAERLGARMILSDIPAHHEYGGPRAWYARSHQDLYECMLAAVAAAEHEPLPREIPACDTWHEAIRQLGAIIEQVTAS